MKTPIFAYEPGNLYVFESVEIAERGVEAIDVKNNLYLFFDAEGRKLEASVYKDKRGVELCSIKEPREPDFDKDLLRKLIIDLLRQISLVHPEIKYPDETLMRMSLDELAKESIMFATK